MIITLKLFILKIITMELFIMLKKEKRDNSLENFSTSFSIYYDRPNIKYEIKGRNESQSLLSNIDKVCLCKSIVNC